MYSRSDDDDAIEQLLSLVEKIHDKTKGSDRIAASKLLKELSAMKTQGFTPVMTLNNMLLKMEETYSHAANLYNKAPHGFTAKPTYIAELNRGGGSNFQRMLLLTLKSKVYKNPQYMDAGHLKIIPDADKVQDKKNFLGEKKSLLGRVAQHFRSKKG